MRLSRMCWSVLSLAFLATCATTGAYSAPAASLDELARQSLATIDGKEKIPGLKQPVEVIRDKQCILHIFAKNQDDLFFA